MNLRRTLSQATLVTGAILFSAGLQTFAFTEPITSPPNADVHAPLNTGPSVQTKSGGLILNSGDAANGLIVRFGNVGIGTINPTTKFHVVGNAKVDGGMKVGNDTSTCTEANAGTIRSVNGSLQACGKVTRYVPSTSTCNDRCSGGIYYGDMSLYGDCKIYSCGYPVVELGWGTITLNP